MKIDINSLDIEQNFWSLYPEFKAIEPFKSLYGKDKGSKEESSKKLWFIAISFHPTSTLTQMEEQERLTTVSRDFMGNKDYYKKGKKELDVLVTAFLSVTTTALERSLMANLKKVDARTKLVDEAVYDMSNWSEIDSLIKGAATLEKEVGAQKARILEEGESVGSARGDKETSATEKGLL